MQLAQDCADGIPPVVPGGIEGDPCNPLPLGPTAPLNLNYPTGAQIWDPAEGFTERGAHMASFELIFSIAYGITGDAIWEYINEMSVGLPGLLGRQIELTDATVDQPGTVAALDQMLEAADQGKVYVIARGVRARQQAYKETLPSDMEAANRAALGILNDLDDFDSGLGTVAHFLHAIEVIGLSGFLAGYTVDEYEVAIDAVRALDFDTVIQGHSDLIGTRADIDEFERLLLTTEREVAAAVAAGRSLEETLELVMLPEYSDWLMYEARRPALVSNMYEFLSQR